MQSSVLFLLLLSGVFPLLGPEKEDSSKYLKTKSVVSTKDDFEGRGVLEPEVLRDVSTPPAPSSWLSQRGLAPKAPGLV